MFRLSSNSHLTAISSSMHAGRSLSSFRNANFRPPLGFRLKRSRKIPLRWKSSQAGGGKSSRSSFWLIIGGSGVAGVVGGFALVKMSPNIRKRIEETAPFSETLFDWILGSEKDDKKQDIVKSIAEKSVKSEEIIQKQKKASSPTGKPATPTEEIKEADASKSQLSHKDEVEKESETISSTNESKPVILVSQANTEKEVKSEVTPSEDEKEDAEWLEELIPYIKSNLSKRTDKAMASINSLTNSYHRKMNAIQLFSLDPDEMADSQKELHGINKELDQFEESVKTELAYFEKAIQETGTLLDSLVRAGKKKEVEEATQLMTSICGQLGEAKDKLTKAKADLKYAVDSRVNALERESQDLSEDVKESLAEDPSAEDDGAVSLENAGNVHVKMKLQEETKQLREEHQREIQQKMEEITNLNQRHQEELRQQAVVHHDHITALLHAKEEQLENEFEWQLQMELQKQDVEQKAQLENLSAALHGINSVIGDVASAKRRGDAARHFFLACDALREAVNAPSSPTVPLRKHVETIDASLHPLIPAVVASLPERALSAGLSTERALQWRFGRVKKRCRRVALVTRDGGIFTYSWSYLHSLLRSEPRVSDDGVCQDPDTFDILAMAENCLAKGDLEMAVRVMGQLEGEPRRVADDWVKEARALLETRQAVHVLLGFARMFEF